MREVHHYGYVVEDLQTAAEGAAELIGAGPFFEINHMRATASGKRFEGRDVAFDHSSAFGFIGDLMIEFSVIHEGTDPGLRAMMAGTAPEVSHVSWLVDSLEEEMERLEAAGLTCFFEASSGPAHAAWFDARAALGHAIEVHQRSDALLEFFDFVQSAARGWDGSEILRPYA